MIKVLAYDFGASSGRAMLGSYDGKKIYIEELHRFSNDPVYLNDTLYWDILRLFHEMKTGLIEARKTGHDDIKSIGIDTWGVDFGLIDDKGRLLENPIHYRDKRTDGLMEEVWAKIGKKNLYDRTGIQFMQFNTIYQLYSIAKNRPELFERTAQLLFMPDLLSYFLTGEKVTEFSMSSTTQMLNSRTGDWDYELLEKLGIPSNILGKVTDSATVIGKLSEQVCYETGLKPITVTAVAGHDTGSAMIAAPADTDLFAFLSSGTWSILGSELQKPVVNDLTYKYEYSNEGGINRTARLIKNIMGLWIYQECRRQWNKEGDPVSFDELEMSARQAKPFACLIDVDHQTFYHPGEMPERVVEFCRRTNQYVPKNRAEIVRCIMESLALKYRYVFDGLCEIVGSRIPKLHMVGGGCKNTMISQFTANALGIEVTSGPIEATAIGNIAAQLIALGEIKDLKHARKVIKDSFEIKSYFPQDRQLWEEKYNYYLNNILNKG
ncbi:MAG TPA: rhamnulokinase family protein [Clostridia bacterium]|nr:MAG: Rhamnulokinase [Firmicutes bacterium ADurb.Bin146]HOD92394.1 rhamnulokinase family protein [Clostridia bacterium]HQM38609.1 rhamnulokinase family protein [Clostridia bacterium]